jgi:hypothetical protein
MSSGIRNLNEFKAAIANIVRETKKAEAEVVNRALKNVAFRAMSLTDYAPPARIQAQLYNKKYALKLAVIALRKKVGQPVTRKGQPVIYKRTGKTKVHGPLTRKAIGLKAKAIIGTRRGHARAIRAGWIPAVLALGGEIRGGAKLTSGGSASKGRAFKATPSKLHGSIVNALVTKNHRGAKTDVKQIEQAQRGLQAAVQTVTSENENYARTKAIENAMKKAKGSF